MSNPEMTASVPLWRDLRAVALLMAGTLKIMANATISPALAGLAASFAATAHAGLLTRLLVPAPSFSVILLAPVVGLLADRYGRRPLLLWGIVLFVIAGTSGLYLPDLPSILGSRLLLGVAVAVVTTAQTALIGDYFSGDRRSTFLSWQVAATNFGGFFFIVLAGMLAGVSPRLPFAVYGLAALCLPIAWIAVTREPSRPAHVSRPSERDDGSAGNWGLAILGVTALTLTTVMLFFMMPTQLPFFTESLGLDSASWTATALGTLTLTGGFVALAHSRILGLLGLARTYALGYALMAMGFGLLSTGTASQQLLLATASIGAGYALVMPNFIIQALRAAPAWRRGFVSGIVTTGMFSGQLISPLVSTPIANGLGFGATFAGTCLILAVMAAAALLASLAGRRGQAD
ncbi:MFS transporter [uncultured Roseibium sp.]|uniref:MFS transporter n=1 Tax=uncultured Roseibium sp. TaxID=1936171 RepID=UPI003216A51F